MRTDHALSATCTLLGILVFSTTCYSDGQPPRAELEFFEKEVRPLLVNQCFACHSEDKKQKGGLVVDSREGILTGGDNGPAIVPGKLEESRLIQAIRYQDSDLKMPPKGKLKNEDIATLEKWVSIGAPWPATPPTTKIGPKNDFNLQDRSKYWSFQPITAHSPPHVKNTEWPRDDLDRFILAKLESESMSPAQPADKSVWLRRVTFDLIGLPPTPQELELFLADDSDSAFEKVVQRLLDSPHYGERWGRHWLDLVRFAETQGHEFDFEIPNAWRYRDYVIRALNADLPYDQFLTEHLAGDLLAVPRRHPIDQSNESIIGTGFFWLGEGKHSPVDIRAEEAARVDNQIDVMSKTFLGLTVSCARCHDHKFDPITTKDYYSLAGFIRSSRMQQAFIDDPKLWSAKLSQLQNSQKKFATSVIQQIVSDRKSAIVEFVKYGPAVASSNPSDSGELKAIETTQSKDLMKRFAEELKIAKSNSGHPLHSLAVLSATPTERFRTVKEELAKQSEEMRKRTEVSNTGSYDLEPFARTNFKNWFLTGYAFGTSPLSISEVLRMQVLNPQNSLPLTTVVAHSGRVSPRLRGVLRSKTFVIDRDRIWIRVAGKDARIRLVMDEFHLIQNPIYGGLATTPPSADKFQWIEIPVGMWPGHRAYLEFIDDSDGFIAVDRIVLSNGGPPADAPSLFSQSLAADPSITEAKSLWKRFSDLGLEALGVIDPAGEVISTATPGQSELVSWMFQNSLFSTIPEVISRLPGELQRDLMIVKTAIQKNDAELPIPNRAVAMADGTPENEHVFIRGNHKTLGDEVPRRMLEVLDSNQASEYNGSGRLQLAERMLAPDNPLVTRVIVNRVWLHHFGEGLVRTPDDFGHMGQRPSHPELLDYLATEFVKEGWSLKRMHRRMVLSSTYRMSSQSNATFDAIDPQNRWLHKMNVVRLEGEAIRDAILAVSGRLSKSQFGPGVLPYLTAYMNGRGRPGSGPLDGDGRRSIYLNVRRNFLSPMLLAFDYPIPFTTIGRRTVSNVPAQALCLMNNQFIVQQAEVWAKRILTQSDSTPEGRIRSMYLAAYSRLPSPDELMAGLNFISKQQQLYETGERDKAWTDLAHVLFNVKEFVFIQ